ncbi:PhzF family phenazine biosynthesis protein [Thermoactinomyces sp. CICC 10521]|jgi:PhzF family phenazine biosynthesis protein|nr:MULTISPECIES: PhzF family phenazine biosynthesis protein [unclassified Thermoactinomyces]MBH8605704.1 PhzF family phenazine biosynthesis protein [Thermoactinomyces sp. CICC 10522]MBH8608896.1 PhzF family phenazine biosynthesis protein [Thermoactinomyces sp. CICC 10521]
MEPIHHISLEVHTVKQIPFQQVDVFSSVPFKGNPVAVILDGNGLSDEQMQSIANWTNLSETTFVCEPTDPRADYRLRIFSPQSELPFAGHPTIGSAYAVLKHGLKPKNTGRLIQECGKGLISIFMDENRLFLTLPNPVLKEITNVDQTELANAIGVSPDCVRASAIVDVGVVWITLQLTDSNLVRRLQPQMERIAALTPPGAAGITVFGLTPSGEETQIEVRSFAPGEGVPEDPVCGSGNGCVAALAREFKLLDKPGYIASQGRCVGRDGRVEVRFHDDGTILLGGHAVTCIEGKLIL